jgi:hypothetical protein
MIDVWGLDEYKVTTEHESLEEIQQLPDYGFSRSRIHQYLYPCVLVEGTWMVCGCRATMQ